MNMAVKPLWSTVLALLLCTATASAVVAQETRIVATKHDFTLRHDHSTGASTFGEMCTYCHTPHEGASAAPVWNDSAAAVSYQMYDPSQDPATRGAAPVGIALACLSCHDGTIGLDVLPKLPDVNEQIFHVGVGTVALPEALFSLSLEQRHDHPIMVPYEPQRNRLLRSKAAVEAAGLRFYTDGSRDLVVCGTCHNPHQVDSPTFLRRDNQRSSLCLTCHIK